MRKLLQILTVSLLFVSVLKAQEGQVSGNVQWDAQYYQEDTLIGAPIVPEGIRSTMRTELKFQKGDFDAGLRFESYQKVIQGFDTRFDGNAIPFRYLHYNKDQFDINVGSFYEQFGSGIILRSYYEPTLGYDGFFDGARVKFTPKKGIELKGLLGKQRFYMDFSPGTVRAFDAEIDLKERINFMNEWKTRIILGGSVVNKYQETADTMIPGNVYAHALRLKLTRGGFQLNAEHARKGQDPNNDNSFIYRKGNASILNLSYFQKGLGVFLSAKRVDNMAFRTGRSMFGLDPMINFHPALTKQHIYALPNFFPYATQPNGEFAINGEIGYKFKRKSALGGKYGTKVNLNISVVNSIEKEYIDGAVNQFSGQEYESSLFGMGDSVYFRDYSLEIDKKFSKKWKGKVLYSKQDYNIAVVQGFSDREIVYQDIVVLEATYKIKPKHAVMLQVQNLSTEQEEGSWGFGMIEYTLAPHWFVAVVDQWNYGNPDESKQIHYLLGSFGYSKNTTRMQFNVGRQRQGITCVGGVCRFVPASNGVSFTLTSSF